MMEAASTSEMSVNLHQATRLNTAEDSDTYTETADDDQSQ
jgi:hypothetical protein